MKSEIFAQIIDNVAKVTELSPDQILEAAFLFWFADEDWSGEGKIWDYMSIK